MHSIAGMGDGSLQQAIANETRRTAARAGGVCIGRVSLVPMSGRAGHRFPLQGYDRADVDCPAASAKTQGGTT